MHTNSTLLDKDKSTMAQQAVMTVAKCSLTSCVSWFSDKFPHYVLTGA